MVARIQPADPYRHMKSKLERDYAAFLQVLKMSGKIADWQYESVGLKLGNGCFFYPDFLVTLPCGEVQLHEAKGYMRDDALVKLKVCARMFAFRLYLVTRKSSKSEFKIDQIHP